MCGIIGLISRTGGEQSQDFILDQYEEQKTRGSQGFGLIRASKDGFRVRRATDALKALIDVSRSPDPIMIFHHRMPTSTENTIPQTHPMIISHDELDFDYAIVHNGVIRNAEALHKIHTEELGYIYKTKTEPKGYYYKTAGFNDTEAFAIELARFLDGKGTEIGSFGSQAFLGMRITKKTQKTHSIFWGTNGTNPLIWDETPIGIVIASELEYGYESNKDVYCEVLTKDLFNKKLNKKKLVDLVNYYEIKFKEEPLYTPAPVHVSGFSHVPATNSSKPINLSPNSETKPIKKLTYTKPETEDVLDSKKTPEGYSDREWAFRKMGLRSLETLETLILDFYDQLPMLSNGYTEYEPDAGFPEPVTGAALDEKDILEDTLMQIEEFLEASLTRSAKINAFYDRKEAQQDRKTIQEMIAEEEEASSGILPTNQTTHGPLQRSIHEIPKQEFLK